MIWTIIAFLCVLGTKFLTAMRLKGLKAKLEAIQPHIEEVRISLREAEEAHEALRMKVEDNEARLNHLHGAVRHLEDEIKAPAESDSGAADRAMLSTELVEEVEAEV